MKKKTNMHNADMKKYVVFAVINLIKGAENAPTVPIMLTHPNVSERTLVGNNSATYTKNSPHKLFITNLRQPNIIISTTT